MEARVVGSWRLDQVGVPASCRRASATSAGDVIAALGGAPTSAGAGPGGSEQSKSLGRRASLFRTPQRSLEEPGYGRTRMTARVADGNLGVTCR